MKTWKKALALVLALSMVIPGVYLGGNGSKEVRADNSGEAQTEETKRNTGVVLSFKAGEVKTDTIDDIPVPNPKKEELAKYKGWLFAGWFSKDTCTLDDVAESEEDKLFAKFVPVGILDVKAQSTPSDSGENIIRFVSSVDTLNYSQAGFEVTYTAKTTNDAGEPEEKVVTRTTTENKKVYKKIDSQNNNIKYEFDPKVVDVESDYFITAKLDITQEPFAGDGVTTETAFTVKAFWDTLDGTRVRGKGRYLSIDDSRSTDSISLTFETENAVEGNLTIDGYSATFEKEGTTVYATVTVDRGNLKSATYLELKENETTVASTIYRNLYTVYTPSSNAYNAAAADTTWYTVYKDAYERSGVTEEREYVIATTADFYALPYIVNTCGETFSKDTIYVVADIVANTGTAAVNAWTAGTGTEYRWVPVGDSSSSAFQGTFDGCGHTISGLYTNATYAYNGFFAYVKDAAFQNFSLANSLFKSTNISGDVAMGSIAAGGDATFRNIHSSANLSSTNFYIGGIIGRVTDGSKAATKCEIINCWFDGSIYSRATSGDVRSGGLMGYIVHGNNKIENSLYSGTIQMAGGNRFGGFYGDSNASSNSVIAISDSLSAGTMVTSSGATVNYVGSITGRLNGNAVTTGEGPIYATMECYSEVIGLLTAPQEAVFEQVAQKNLNGMSAAYYMPGFDYENAWALQSNGIPIPKAFASESLTVNGVTKTADTSWYDENPSQSTFTISEAAGLYGLMVLANKGTDFTGKEIKLGADIDLNPGWKPELLIEDGTVIAPSAAGADMWIPIGTSANPFTGTFNGDGYSIRGIYIDKRDDSNEGTGLFGMTQGATIENLKVEDGYIYGNVTSRIGSIAGDGENTTLNKVYSNVGIYSVNSSNIGVGGLIGRVNENTASTACNIENCVYAGTLVLRAGGARNENAGGLFGYALRGTTCIENSLFEGIIDYKYTGANNSDASLRIGGFWGQAQGTINVSNSLSAGSITVSSVETRTAAFTHVAPIGGRTTATDSATNVFAANDCIAAQNSTSNMGTESEQVADVNTEYAKSDILGSAGAELVGKLGASVWTIREGKVPGLIWLEQ